MELKNLANTNLVMLSMLLLISKVGAQNSNFGTWEECTIVKQWDDGNAYRVKQKRTGVEGWAPVDINAYIKPVSSE